MVKPLQVGFRRGQGGAVSPDLGCGKTGALHGQTVGKRFERGRGRW